LGQLAGVLKFALFIFVIGLAALSVSCSKHAVEVITPTPTLTTPTQQVFQVKGTIIELLTGERSVRIKHEAIPGYMDAMTMPFDVKDTNELAGLKVGDGISFRLMVTAQEGWIDQLKKISAPRTNTLPTTGPFRFVREVEPLNIGDPLPDYHFTNHLGQPVKLAQFRGQALAFTFIFTRCPYPNFCPLMSNNFREVQDALLKIPNAPTNWHLFTISFDPDWDTPARLKAYAEGLSHDPRHWSFLTGELVDITAIAEQVGEVFTRDADGPGISHNLRTVVVDARGRVQKIIPENKWKPAELVAEIVKAATATE
jgi:protein SCO1/2